MKEVVIEINRKKARLKWVKWGWFFRLKAVNRWKKESFSFKMPDSWDELSMEDWRFFAELTTKNLSMAEMNMVAVFRLCRIPNEIAHLFSVDQVINSIGECQFITKPPITTVNPFKSLKVGKVTLIGPDDSLDGMTTEQFNYCETAFKAWQDSQSEQALDLFMASFFRLGDFDNKKLNQIADLLKEVDPITKVTIVLVFTALRANTVSMYPYVFKKPGDENADDFEENYEQQKLSSFRSLIHDLAGDKMGTVDDIDKRELNTVLLDLETMIIKDIKRKREEEG